MNTKKTKTTKKTGGKDQAAVAPEAPLEAPEAAPDAATEAAPQAPGEIPEPPHSPPPEQPPEQSGDRQGELEDEVADLNDKLLRAMAELENFRRRAEKERSDVSKYAIANFARDMLTVADNLRRALDSATNEGAEDNAEGLAAGIELTERGLLATLERHGITKIEAMGKLFDHDLHQAMFEVEDKDKPAGTIVEELQAGYVLKGRLLRPAMVGLAKGGPQPEAKAEAAAPQKDGDGTGNGEDTGDGPQHIDTSA
ncbi:MAG: nucleotide exchange factor GrpE [Alphaproteobacteria bacterium]